MTSLSNASRHFELRMRDHKERILTASKHRKPIIVYDFWPGMILFHRKLHRFERIQNRVPGTHDPVHSKPFI